MPASWVLFSQHHTACPAHHDISDLCADDYRRTACTSLLKYIVEKDQYVQGERISHTIQAVKGMTFSHISVYYSVQRKKESAICVFRSFLQVRRNKANGSLAQ